MTADGLRILLTGATGQVGGTVLGELLDAGHRVICLARGRDGRSAELRVRDTLARIGRDPRLPFEVVEGELVDGGISLTPADRARLVGVDRIVHSAARVAFEVEGHNEPFETNIGGTLAMLELARSLGHVPFTHVSTAYVCGRFVGPVAERFHERPDFHNPYEASKWEAERQVRLAGEAGLPVRIARPSIIVGGAGDGRALHFQGFYLVCRAVSLLCQLADHDPRSGYDLTVDGLDVPGALDAPINLVTADYVAAAVARIGTLGPEVRGIYHLTHPSPPTLGDLTAVLSGYYRLYLPCIETRRPRPRPAPRGEPRIDPARLRRRQRVLARANQSFWRLTAAVKPYFSDTPVFDTTAARALLDPYGIHPAPVDSATLLRVLEYAESVGFGRDLPQV